MNIESVEHRGKTYRLIAKTFEELQLLEWYAISTLRQEVFVVEQECPFLDNDSHDIKTLHILLYDSSHKLLAYARVADKNIIYKEANIGRVCTAVEYRKAGLGRLIFEQALQLLIENYGYQNIKIQAQSYLVNFYQSFGFEVLNEAYLDVGIYHNDMMRHV